MVRLSLLIYGWNDMPSAYVDFSCQITTGNGSINDMGAEVSGSESFLEHLLLGTKPKVPMRELPRAYGNLSCSE